MRAGFWSLKNLHQTGIGSSFLESTTFVVDLKMAGFQCR